MVLVIFLSAILFFDLIPLLTVFLIQIPLIIIAKIFREWVKTLRGAIVLAMLIFITNLLSFYFFNNHHITWSNVEYSFSLTLRFIVLITSFSIFFLTTSPDKLSLTLEDLRVPFEFNFAFITAIRFVPVLADEAQTIMDAQRSRGLELDKGSFLTKIKNYIPILLPLIINSIRRSMELAEAMESRAFGAIENRTNLYELKMRGVDYLIFLISLSALFLVIYIKIMLPPFQKLLGSGYVF